jgi:WD40 repeat protein
MRTSTFLLMLSCMLLAPRSALAVKRVALLVGANVGWEQDKRLSYAEEDARQLEAVLIELGGFQADSIVFLSAPTTERLLTELETLQQRLRGLADEETLFLFYYSGHADERRLHLRGAPLLLEELYHRLREVPATVKLGILDACSSGSILKVKGGRPAPEFQLSVRDELRVRGTVILTSSGADELSQEARALSGSFFTHHLVSGLRGAADKDGDRRVSLEEVFLYASVQTLLDTHSTRKGVQRPGFLNRLGGQSPLYLTRLEGPVGLLLFPPGRQRCFVLQRDERLLVAELAADRPRAQQLALPPGAYLLKCDDGVKYQVASVELKAGTQRTFAQLAFREAPLSEGVLKGAGRSAEALESLARLLGAQAELVRAEHPEQPEPSVLLALTSLRLSPSPTAHQVLRQGLERLPRLGPCMRHEAGVLEMAWSADGTHLTTTSADQRVRVWSAETGKEQAQPMALKVSSGTPASRGSLMAYSQDKRLLATVDPGSSLARVLEVPAGRVLRMPHSAPVTAVAWSPDGRRLATSSEDHTACVWSLSESPVVRIPAWGGHRAMAFSPDGQTLVTATDLESVQVWDAGTGRERVRLEETRGASLLALSPNGRLLAVAQGALASVWEVATGRAVARMEQGGFIYALAFSPDGRLLVSAGGDGSARLWEAATGREVRKVHHDGAVRTVAFSPDGRRLATGGEDQTARLWEVETGRELSRWVHASLPCEAQPGGAQAGCGEARLLGTGARLESVSFSPDGSALATATREGGVWVWNVGSGRELLHLRHPGFIRALAFSPDSRALAIATGDATARIWLLATGQELAHFTAKDGISFLQYSGEGRHLVTASQRGEACVWDLSSGRELACIREEAITEAMLLSLDGRLLAMAQDGEEDRGLVYALHTWRPEELIEQGCARLRRNLTPDEWRLYAGDQEPYLKACPELP